MGVKCWPGTTLVTRLDGESGLQSGNRPHPTNHAFPRNALDLYIS